MRRLIVSVACIASLLSALALAQTAAATTRTPIPNCPRTITNKDNGKTIRMARGSCATLKLDDRLVWTVPQSSSNAVSVFDTETFAPDQEWGLRALHPGNATITSTGRLKCKPGEVCPLFIELFSVHVHVVPSYH
jgi:hypothetical protein